MGRRKPTLFVVVGQLEAGQAHIFHNGANGFQRCPCLLFLQPLLRKPILLCREDVIRIQVCRQTEEMAENVAGESFHASSGRERRSEIRWMGCWRGANAKFVLL